MTNCTHTFNENILNAKDTLWWIIFVWILRVNPTRVLWPIERLFLQIQLLLTLSVSKKYVQQMSELAEVWIQKVVAIKSWQWHQPFPEIYSITAVSSLCVCLCPNSSKATGRIHSIFGGMIDRYARMTLIYFTWPWVEGHGHQEGECHHFFFFKTV